MLQFSVLMAVYGKDDPQLFHRAISSVYSNTRRPAEFWLVVDGPISSALEDVIAEFRAFEGFGVHRLASNRGLATALNEGLRLITNEWVFRADADDYNLHDRFEKQLAQISDSVDLIGGSIQEVDSNGTALTIRQPPADQLSIRKYARYRNPFNHMTVAFRKDLALQIGGYPNLHLKEDYALWTLMLANGARAKNLPDVLVRATAGREMYARRGGINYVRSEIQMQKHLIHCGLQGVAGALVVGVLRSAVFLMPSRLRGLVYENLLRKKRRESHHG